MSLAMPTKFGSGGGSAFSQIQDLKAQLLSMKKSNHMKDDTILFLQKEKESLAREIKHYESICAGVEADIAMQNKYDAEVKALRMDIQHYKEAVKRQKQARKSLARENSCFDVTHKGLTTEISDNLNTMLQDIQTENSTQIRRQLGDLMAHADHENTWHLLEIINKALTELQTQFNKYKQLIESSTRKPVMRYSHKIGEPIPHSQPPRTAMSRLVKQNLMTHRRDSDPFRSQSAAGMVAPEYRTIPGFLPGLQKKLTY